LELHPLRTIAADHETGTLTGGGTLYSVSAFALAGPLEAEELTAAYTMRTVDASPPFDKSVARQR
jgi:hypothetical protein